MLFLRVGWMRRYAGLADDQITGGGKYVAEFNRDLEHQTPPCEVRNFEPHEGTMYGFVRMGGGKNLDIRRLGAGRDARAVGGVLVVWVARAPEGGVAVVGWYRDATVYRGRQPAPADSGRAREGRVEWGYRVWARAENCTLLPPEARELYLPSGAMGRSPAWYASTRSDQAFRRRVRAFIANVESARD
jgi:5-methylcytosine-specific restriction protein A